MIFVVDAIGSISSAFCANSTCPLSASISTAAFAGTVNGSDARAQGRQQLRQTQRSTVRFQILFMQKSPDHALGGFLCMRRGR